MKGYLLFAAFFACISSTAQLARTPLSAVYPSLQTYSTQEKDAFSFRANSASLAGVKNVSAGVFSERRFLLRELSSYAFAAALPTSSGNFGLQGDCFGAGLYNETSFGFAYGRSAGSKVDIGAGFHYTAMKAAGYGVASTVTFDAGAVFHLTDAVQTGVSVYNPVGMKFGKDGEEKLPSIYSAGIGYDASPQLFIGAEIQKVEDQPLNVNAGLQYLFAEKLMARCGICSAAAIYYLGFGVKLQRLRIDAAASFHPYLGVTPGLLLLYSSK
ncbi:hypothetical protein [Flavisolibacter ginsenosidimutans]|uniref:PorT family protein n=1 Tax=Flavisolibacter ginsenosidimutans TaxID=661481 RepID=A0A5B8UJJ0_9BACT|nr:hypothetical protein [Flavisolibacter ginsenosidimutans]QEC56871.1 hypothetical protein FSB75_13520 [Flavisolibacter ginsenosidimutans]